MSPSHRGRGAGPAAVVKLKSRETLPRRLRETRCHGVQKAGFARAKARSATPPGPCGEWTYAKCESARAAALGPGGRRDGFVAVLRRVAGNVLNCTISAYAYVVIRERDDWALSFHAGEIQSSDEVTPTPRLDTSSGLILHRGVYNRIVREFNHGRPLALDVDTSVDAPPGSGLGSSSALVVALVKAFAELLRLPLGDYDIARLALEIERHELALAGGKQDQYAAAFGGCNFIEFLPNERVIVNPLRVHEPHLLEIECSMLVCHTGRSRISSDIIEMQTSNMRSNAADAMAALQQIKQDAIEMKLAVLRGDVAGMAEILNRSWAAKKRTANGVSSSNIDGIYELALKNGAIAFARSPAQAGAAISCCWRRPNACTAARPQAQRAWPYPASLPIYPTRRRILDGDKMKTDIQDYIAASVAAARLRFDGLAEEAIHPQQ